MRTWISSTLPSNTMNMMSTSHNKMTSLQDWMERTKTMQAMRTLIQNKVTTRTHKTRRTMTATTAIVMEMTPQKQKCWIMTSTLVKK